MPGLGRPLLLGHRGARAVRSIPENTLQSFDRALADGCDGFEFDVRLTSDAAAVICHNPRSGSVEIERASSAQVSHLPRFEHVLSLYRERAFLDIELKAGGIEKIIAALLRKYPPRRGFVVSSFIPNVLEAVRREDDKIPLGLICDQRDQLRRWKDIPVEYVIPHWRRVSPSLVSELHTADKKILVWTVNNAAAMVRLRDLGVDGIVSDNTQLLCRTLSKPPRQGSQAH